MLALLALDIQKRQERLSEIRLRERRSTLLFSVYALALWVAYVSLWYTDLVPTLSGHARYSKVEKSVEAVPVFLGPIVCVARFFPVSPTHDCGIRQNTIYSPYRADMVHTDRRPGG